MVLAFVAVRGIRNSRTGRVLIALRDNEAAVESYGVSPVRAKLTAFAISGFLAAVAGAIDEPILGWLVEMNWLDRFGAIDVLGSTPISAAAAALSAKFSNACSRSSESRTCT